MDEKRPITSEAPSTVAPSPIGDEKGVGFIQEAGGIRGWLMKEVDTKQCTGPLSAFCFMTGFMYVLGA